MTNEWLSVAQLIEVPQLPNTPQGIRKKAESEQWQKRGKTKGKGYEYHVTSLPAAAQGYLAEKAINESEKSAAYIVGKAIVEKNNRQEALSKKQQQRVRECGTAALMQLTGKARERAEAKLIIISAYKSYLSPFIQQGCKTKGIKAFITAYNNQELSLSTYSIIKTIGQSKIYRWESELNQNGAAALAGKYNAQRSSSKIEQNPELLQLCKGLVFHNPDIKAAVMLEAIEGQNNLHNKGWVIPSRSSVARWLNSFEKNNPLLMKQLRDPDGFKNSCQVAWGHAAEAIIRVNQLWEFDSTPTDVLLKDGRYSIIGMIDVFSRRPRVILHPTSSAEGVCRLLRKAILDLGVPEAAKTDNGKDYVSKRVISAFAGLDIEHLTTRPFSGDEKPFIERFFRTWAHGISTLLPGYAGHDVATRQKIRARQPFSERIMKKGEDVSIELTSTELQTLIDDWIEHVYEQKIHRMLGCSPLQKWQTCRTTIKTIRNERALDMLLSPVPAQGGKPAGIRTVNKDVGIVVEGLSYVSPELGTFIGERIFASWDQADVSRIYIFNSINLEFICVAECPELAGHQLSMNELSKAAQRKQAQALALQRKELRQAGKKVNPGEVARDVIEAKRRQFQNISSMPKNTTPHTSDGLSGAITATGCTSNKPEMTQAERTEFAARRTQQLQKEKLLKNAHRSAFRTKEDEIKWLVQQSLKRALLDDEQAKINTFKQAEPETYRLIERMVGLKPAIHARSKR